MFALVADGLRRRFQRPPSTPTLLAGLVLFLSLSGVAYAGATIGSAEIIDNSVQSIDLRDGGAVAGIDVIDNSITGADVNETTLKGVARKIVWTSTSAASPPLTTIATLGAFTVKASCNTLSGGLPSIRVYVRGPAGDFETLVRTVDLRNRTSTIPFAAGLPANVDYLLLTFNATETGGWFRQEGSLYLHSGALLVKIDYHLLEDARTATYTTPCSFYGVGVDAN